MEKSVLSYLAGAKNQLIANSLTALNIQSGLLAISQLVFVSLV